MATTLISIDVWDTLLRRRCHPDEVKLHTARVLSLRHARRVRPWYSTPWAVLIERQNVERDIGEHRRTLGLDDEYRLTEVLSELVKRCFYTPPTDAEADRIAAALAEDELSFEARITYADPGAAACIEAAARHAGERAAMVAMSDFYVHGEELTALVRRHLPVLPIRRTIVSCDCGLNKRSGRLFYFAQRELCVRPEQHVHIGDHPWSDVESPRRIGVRAVHYRHPVEDAKRRLHNLRFAARHAGLAHETAILLREAAQPTRQGLRGGAAERALFAAGRRYAPVFHGLVLAAMERAVREGVVTVHYFTREGQFFRQVHEALLAAKPGSELLGVPAPKSELLEVSRVATFLPSLREATTQELMRLWSQYSTQSSLQLLATLGIDPYHAEPFLARHGIPAAEVIRYPWTDARVQALFADPLFRRRVEQMRDARREELVAYLAQKGFGDGPRVIVDIGWRGSIQDNLCRVLPGASISGVYLGLQTFLNEQPVNGAKHAFGPDMNRDERAIGSILDEVAPLEMLTNGRGGSVAGYRRDADGVVRAVRTSDPAEDAVFDRAAKHFQRGVLSMTPLIADRIAERAFVAADWRGACIDLLRQLVTDPPREVARAFFSLKHNETFGVGGFVGLGIAAAPDKSLAASVRAGDADAARRAIELARKSRWAHGYLRLHGLERALASWNAREHAHRCTSLFEDEARMELASLETARSWRLLQRIKSQWWYRAVADRRYGASWRAAPRPGAVAADPHANAPAHLAEIKRSRAFRAIAAAKSTPPLRMYAGWKYAGAVERAGGGVPAGRG